jgi:LuxR family maltose regulon positive regulatory protein
LLQAIEVRNQLGSTNEGEKPKRTGGAGPAVSQLVEPLTEREIDILVLMAEGLTYNEIAERETVSLNTVRTHVKNIYAKLSVHKRSQAIAKSKRLNIL